jgi:hypothetical protein
LDLRTLFQHDRQHLQRISLCFKERDPFTVSQAKVTKRAKFLDNFMVREPQHNSEGHIFDPNEIEVAGVIVDMQVAEPLSRGIRHMVCDRCRNINTLPTGQLRAKVKIRVLILKEEILVEHATPIQHCYTTGTDDGLRGIKLSSLLSQSTIKSDPGSSQGVAGTIHRLGIREDELRRAYSDATILQHRLNKVFKPRLGGASSVINQS